MSHQSDVLIVGAGPTGLYAALLLSHMGCSIRIIDKKGALDPYDNPNYIWSPRSLQLLQAFDLTNMLAERGQRHWRLETYTNKGYGSNAITTDRRNHNVWENEATEFSWSLSCECDRVCRAMIDTLEQRGVEIQYNHELVDLENHPTFANASIRTPTSSYDWKSQIVLGADGGNSLVRQKLGIAYERPRKSSTVFYTVEATVNTNFPSARSMSSVTKDENTLFIVGHRNNKTYISFEHRPKWSRLTIDDDVPLILAQKHIKSVLDPYQIEFTQVHAYRRWSASERVCEEYAIDRKYFLAGGSAQTVSPEGLLGSDLGLEQVHNLCWKIALVLKHRGSPQLLDTYADECQSKWADTISASNALIHLFTCKTPTSGTGLNSTPDRELGYQLHRNKHSLVGETPYHANLVNVDTTSTISFNSHNSNDTIQAAAVVTMRAQCKIHPGSPGTLAQNSKLKPYTLFSLLVSPSSKTPSPPSSTKNTSTDDRPPRSRTSKRRWRSRSNSVSGPSRFFAPFLGSIAKRQYDIPFTTTTNNSVQPSSLADRWRMIKTTHYRLVDRMSSGSFSFTLLVFAGSIAERENLALLQRFRRHLEEPHSFYKRYEKLHYPFNYTVTQQQQQQQQQQQRSSSSSTTSTTKQRDSHGWRDTIRSSRSSTTTSSSSAASFFRFSASLFPSPPTSPVSSSAGRSSFDQPRPSIDTYTYRRARSTCSTTAPATSSIINNNNDKGALFSFLYITTSTRTEVTKFLNDTKPSIVHATFPFGLDTVYLDHDRDCHTAYRAATLPATSNYRPTIVVVRPDGYISARVELQNDTDFEKLDQYFDSFLRPPIDMTSAAAMAADFYDL